MSSQFPKDQSKEYYECYSRNVAQGHRSDSVLYVCIALVCMSMAACEAVRQYSMRPVAQEVSDE